MGQSHIWETNSYWSMNLFLHETQMSTIVFTTASHCSTSSARWIQSTVSNTVYLRFILILSLQLLSVFSGLFSLSFPTICPYPLSLVPMRTTCPTYLTILLSKLHLAKIINYEALCWVYFSTILLLPPSSVRHCTAVLYLRCNNSISFPPSYRRGRQWHRVFSLWSLNEGQIRSRVGGGVNKN